MRLLRILTLFILATPCFAQSVVGSRAVMSGSNAMTLAVNNTVSNSTSSGTAVTVTISIPAGHTAVINCGQGANSSSTATITDTGSNTWTQSVSGYSTVSGARSSGMWYSYLTSSLTSVTCTWTGPLTAGARATVYDIVGTVATSIEDSSVNQSSASTLTTFSSGSLTTSNSLDILLFGVSTQAGGVFTAGSGFTLPAGGQFGSTGHIATQYEIVNTTQSGTTTSITGPSSTGYTSVFLALKSTTIFYYGFGAYGGFPYGS